jgi:hypothetical protein
VLKYYDGWDANITGMNKDYPQVTEMYVNLPRTLIGTQVALNNALLKTITELHTAK